MDQEGFMLDDSAASLFNELGGIETEDRTISGNQIAGTLASGFAQADRALDDCRICIIKTVHLLASYFIDARMLEGVKKNGRESDPLLAALRELSGFPDSDDAMVIRFRGYPSGGEALEKIDYTVCFGKTTLDLSIAETLARRRGVTVSHLPGQLTRAFRAFAERKINSLLIRLPDQGKLAIDRLFASLDLAARFDHAAKTGTDMIVVMDGRSYAVPVIFDENQRPDPNLTLLFGLSRIDRKTAFGLVRQVSGAMQTNAKLSSVASSVYNALLTVKSLKSKLVRPSLEINNEKWLLSDKNHVLVSKKAAQFARVVMRRFGSSSPESGRIIQSVYGKDYDRINSFQLGMRLKDAGDFLSQAKSLSKEEDQLVHEEVISNIRRRLGMVDDSVMENIFIRKGVIRVRSGEKEQNIGKTDSRISKLLAFFKAKSGAKIKLKSIGHKNVDFTDVDFAVLAKDFGISVSEIKDLVALIRSCFDDKGRFHRAIFEKNIPAFIQYEAKVFEFLWAYLNGGLSRNDRVALLNALQILITHMKKPQMAVRYLLKDFLKDPSRVEFSDRNALMLSILLARKYNKELHLDIEQTPEEILLVKKGLRTEVCQTVSAFLDEKKEQLFEKVQFIHEQLLEGFQNTGQQSLPMRYLVSLERETNIFLSLMGSKSGLTVLRSMLEEYGDPSSLLFETAAKNGQLGMWLNHLRVIVRGLGRVGLKSDLILLEKVRNRSNGFANLSEGPAQIEAIRRLMEFVDGAQKEILSKMDKTA